MHREYIGASIYVEVDEPGHLVLTKDDGSGASNRIYLEPEVLIALIRYAARYYDLQAMLDELAHSQLLSHRRSSL